MERVSRRLYRAWPARRLMVCNRLAVVVAVAALAIGCGGCSYQLGSMFEKSDALRADHTRSIRATKTAMVEPALPAMEPEGEAALRLAATELLSRNERDASQPWENPRTGARGTVTPIAAAYTQDGLTCRDFLASYVREGSEAWLQGEACLKQAGQWEVRSLKPWNRT